MRRNRVLVLAAATLLCLAACTHDSPADGGADSGAGAAGGSSESGGAVTEQDSTAGAEPTATDAPGEGSDAGSGGKGSEVLPEATDTPTSLGELLADDGSAGRLTAPPATASEAGLVDSFPTEILMVPEGANVRSSSVSADGSRAQATLDASVPGTCADALIAYRGWFTRGGFQETETSETGDASRLAFARENDSVTLTTASGDQACTVGLFAVLEVTAG